VNAHRQGALRRTFGHWSGTPLPLLKEPSRNRSLTFDHPYLTVGIVNLTGWSRSALSAMREATYARSMTQVQDNYRVVSAGFDAAVESVAPDQWGTQSPCEEWTARDIVAHIVEGHRSVLAGLRGEEPEGFGIDEDPTQAWEEVSQAVAAITHDPDVVTKEIDGPVGKMAVGEVIDRFVTMDLLVHTWDLARTVGADEHLDEDSVARAYNMLKPMDEMIRRPNFFGPKLDPPVDADLRTEFLYFVGRRA
jgi:uncharacterized protein (TIGR03086 family)